MQLIQCQYCGQAIYNNQPGGVVLCPRCHNQLLLPTSILTIATQKQSRKRKSNILWMLMASVIIIPCACIGCMVVGLNSYQETENARRVRIYNLIANELVSAANNLEDSVLYKNKIINLWMEEKRITSDEKFGYFLVDLLDNHQFAARNVEEQADRLVAQGQLSLTIYMELEEPTTKQSHKVRNDLQHTATELRSITKRPLYE